ncbi:MAG: hypothetical protein KDB04_04145 [Acidimicrobiales bacterium]|nr:hypothetical protein [Acidimicrobiales bacterium]
MFDDLATWATSEPEEPGRAGPVEQDAAQVEARRVAQARAAWESVAGPVLPDDPGERRAALHADLDALLDAPRTDHGSSLAEVLVGWDRLRRSIDGSLVGAVAGFSASAQWALDAYRSPTAWLVGSLGLKRAAAGSLRATCVGVADHPVLAKAAASGRLSLEHLRALLAARSAPIEEAFDADAADLVERAASMSVDALVRHLERWRLDALAELGANEPDGPEPPAPAGTTCKLRPLGWGRALGELDLDPVAAAEVIAGLDAEYEAMRRDGQLAADPRSLAEIHGEAFLAIWRRGTHRSTDGPAPLLHAVVDLDTLLRRAGDHDPEDRIRRIAELVGHGPIDDATIAELASAANIALLVTHPTTGLPLWHGRAHRLATPAQRAAVLATTGHCTFPGCTVAGTRCQIDHLTAWTHDGETNIDNLTALCAHHNRLKHRWNLTVTRQADGTLTFTHPDGRTIESRYTTTSDPPRPATRARDENPRGDASGTGPPRAGPPRAEPPRAEPPEGTTPPDTHPRP